MQVTVPAESTPTDTTPTIAIDEDFKGISCIEDFTVQLWETTYIAVLCCAMLFYKFGTFKISINHILENISHILGDMYIIQNVLE